MGHLHEYNSLCPIGKSDIRKMRWEKVIILDKKNKNEDKRTEKGKYSDDTRKYSFLSENSFLFWENTQNESEKNRKYHRKYEKLYKSYKRIVSKKQDGKNSKKQDNRLRYFFHTENRFTKNNLHDFLTFPSI